MYFINFIVGLIYILLETKKQIKRSVNVNLNVFGFKKTRSLGWLASYIIYFYQVFTDEYEN